MPQNSFSFGCFSFFLFCFVGLSVPVDTVVRGHSVLSPGDEVDEPGLGEAVDASTAMRAMLPHHAEVLLLLVVRPSDCCTNFLITKGASTDGANHFSYSNDGGQLYGELTFLEAKDHAPGTMRDVWRWDDGRYLGSIPEVAHTYRVVGNMNEHQLAIGEECRCDVWDEHELAA